nr:energy transducer TonB [Vibrio vulnificus]
MSAYRAQISPALDAIKRWRYQPQIVDGQAQTIYGYTTKIEFKMAQ